MNRHRQAGLAIVLAVLLVALAAASATFMLAQQDLRARQLESLAARAQASAAAQAGLDHALRKLADTAFAPARGVLAVGEVEVEIDYADAQALFNLNNLVRGREASAPDLRLFGRMLAAAKLAPELANAVIDAIDADSQARLPGGAEDLDYLAMEPPRRAANRPLIDPGHLARLKGFTPQAAAHLQPWVTALPEATSINVNSAPAPLLVAAIPGLDLEAAEKLLASRARAPFKSIDEFRAQLPEPVLPLPGLALDVSSRYVLVSSRARAGRVEVAYRALIGRKGAAREGLLWRRLTED